MPMSTSSWPQLLPVVPRSVLLLAASLLLACGSENLIPPAHQDEADLYWDLELDHHSVAMSTRAPYDTLQLVAAPRNFRGAVLPGLSGVTYTSTDPDRVVVTPDGQLVAVGRTFAPVEVVATLTANHIRHSDTVVVSVTEDPVPPVLAAFSIHPVPPDSAKSPVVPSFLSVEDTLRPRATSVDGALIPVYSLDSDGYLPVDFRSSDSTVAVIGRNLPAIQAITPGPVTIYASTTAFGITKVDTLPYRIGWPVVSLTQVYVPIPNPNTPGAMFIANYDIPQRDLWIGTGGVVVWLSVLSLPFAPDSITVDIVFTNADLPNIGAMRPAFDLVKSWSPWADIACSSDCDSGGNLLLTKSAPYAARRFTTPGTYEFHSDKAGISGRIVVVDER